VKAAFIIHPSDMEQLKKDIAEYVGNNHLERIAKNGLRIAEGPLIESLMAAFKRTLVWRALSGEYTAEDEDVIAHMGLTEGLSQNALSEIEDIIRTTLSLGNPAAVFRGSTGSFSGFSNAASVRFNLSFARLEDEIKSIQSGSYTSVNVKGRTTLIPWITWLIDGWEYPGYSIGFSDNLDNSSRSGRAIMIYEGNYNTMDYHNFAERNVDGKSNFIIDALLDEVWQADAVLILRRSMQEAANE
jgi:hypothetical protein